MRKMVKVLTVIISVIMVLANVAGCSQKGNEAASTAPKGNEAETSAQGKETGESPKAESGEQDIDWPTKTIEIVVPGGAGGDTDLCTRMLAEKLQDELGQPIIITNIGGSGGSIGAREVVQADPNGYKLLMFHPGLLLTEISGVADFGFKDFDMAANVFMDETLVWVTNKASEFNDMKELVEYAKANKVQYATDFGGHTHAVALMVQDAAGVEFNIIDAGGSSDRVAALLGNQIDLIATSYGMIKDYVESGDFKVLGVAADERSEVCPDVPTFKEQGIDVTAPKNYFLSWPKGIDPAIQKKFAAAVEKACSDPELQNEILETMCIETYYMGPEDLYAYLEEMFNQYEPLLKK
ncbi:tripartite tricarboxylate transporter substrate binding protein [Clostridium sp. MCC353]|uniref:tripartite tricarboxylate transporter substrate binding protein n=1 Tax=Clostridium sp. MCC353 TaxID=2592646 RepID=UPI001C02CEB7|nr:tripartite tricarboxylate transporter substrate binding protein [Clostridium sp. MCC353]MBT9778061.1 tripartite tricarboxylate transporter substrate binding protein [Clostridium sp. MCC353]